MTSDQISIEVNGKVYVFQLSAYGNEQDQDQTDQEGTVKVNGNELELQGSLWRKVKIDHKITPKTILEFEFQGIKEGEIHSIGFDNDNVVYDKNLLNDQTTDDTTFQIWGSQESSPKWNPITNGIHRYATNLGWHKYKILLEDHFNGRFSYLTFGNDQDVTNPTATAKFRGLKIYEEDNIIPALEIAATSAEDPEGNTDTTPFTFTVTRTGNTTGTNSVYWTVAGSGDNSANAADFANSVFPNSVFPTGTITFEADETTRKFTVDVNGDTDFEKDETFTVTLSNPSNGAIISTASATGTITNDDDNNTIPTLAIAATSAVKPEGNTGSTPFTFTVTRTGNTQEESSVDWLILGNKDDFEDGVLPSGTVTFEVDQTSQEINVNVKGDTVIERNEIFQCWIHNPVNATISTNQANGIIISDDIALKTIKIVSDYAYTISSDGLLIIDISDPTSPNSIGGFDIHLPNLQKTVQDIAVMGKYAYLVTHLSTIEIIDISDSTNPTPISSFDFSSGFYGIEVVGNYIYVSTLRELKIIDITNPVNPKHIQDFYLSDLVWDVEVEGNYGYVSSRNSGLQIIDVTNPANPKRIGGYDTDGDTVSVEVMGSYLYVADGSAGVQIIDISNPANPKRIGGYDTDGTTWDVKIVEQYAYIADGNAGLQIIDISDPANPTHIKKFNIEGNAWDVEVLGDYAYVATDAGLKVINWNDKEVDKPNDDNVNFQEITSLANLKVAPGKSLSVPLFYNTSTNDNTLGGIGLRLHYDSSDIVFKDTTNLLSTNLFGNVTDNSDTENFDADTNTNRYIQFQYLDFAGNWPNQTLPLKLGDFNFTAQSTFANTQLNITSSSLAAGYGLKFDPLLVSKQTWNLDIDGNGKVDALTDGIMAVRYMFGSAFSGNALIAGAIAPNATRSLSEIQTYLQEGTTQKYLDIDGNGKVDALTDGIMAVRYMFGSAFSGNVLIAGAIAPDAIRDLSGIQSYLSGLNTLS